MFDPSTDAPDLGRMYRLIGVLADDKILALFGTVIAVFLRGWFLFLLLELIWPYSNAVAPSPLKGAAKRLGETFLTARGI